MKRKTNRSTNFNELPKIGNALFHECEQDQTRFEGNSRFHIEQRIDNLFNFGFLDEIEIVEVRENVSTDDNERRINFVLLKSENKVGKMIQMTLKTSRLKMIGCQSDSRMNNSLLSLSITKNIGK